MVRLTLLIDEADNSRLLDAAKHRGVSKAQLVREWIGEKLPQPEGIIPRWEELLGQIDLEPLDVSIDEYLYGKRTMG